MKESCLLLTFLALNQIAYPRRAEASDSRSLTSQTAVTKDLQRREVISEKISLDTVSTQAKINQKCICPKKTKEYMARLHGLIKEEGPFRRFGVWQSSLAHDQFWQKESQFIAEIVEIYARKGQFLTSLHNDSSTKGKFLVVIHIQEGFVYCQTITVLGKKSNMS